MKRLILGLALVAAALAAPLAEEDSAPLLEEASANFTNGVFHNALGWAGTGGGTNGGNGGTQFTVFDPFALRDALNSNDRRLVRFRGRMDLTALFQSSPGVRLRVGSYTTLLGQDRTAELTGGGLSVGNVRQVIIRNVRIFNALSYASGERPNGNGGIANLGNQDFSSIDAVEVSGSHHVWIDHCYFSDHPWNMNNRPRRHDGQIDIVRGADLVTVSNSIFTNHVFTSLVGNGEGMGHVDRGRLRVTFYANWFRGTAQRNPYVRFGQVHVLNNLYTDIGDYAVGSGIEAQIHLERNVFVNCRNGRGAIISNINPRGRIYTQTNVNRNCSFQNNIHSSLSWSPWNSYNYRAIAIGDVENHVRRWAGPQ